MRRKLWGDSLNIFLLCIALVLFFLRSTFTLLLAGGCIAIALVRCFSTDPNARNRENDRFRGFWDRMKMRSQAKKAQKVRTVKPQYASRPGESHLGKENKSEAKAQRAKAKEAKKAQKEKKRQQKNDTEHVYFHCPKCNQEMRAPKGKGKILVTCKNCGEKFEKTT